MSNKLTKFKSAPVLKVAPDEEVAERLRALVRDAEDGLRRVLTCGLYIEWIAASLPHGQLLPWMEANCPDIPQRTIYNWRTLARSVCEWVGLKFATMANLELPADQLLTLPEGDLPAKVLPWRKKIEKLLSENDTAKQLFFDLKVKQGELDDTGVFQPKIGRAKGEGGASRAQRISAKERLLQLEAESLELWAQEVARKLTQVSDERGLGLIGDETLDALCDAMDYAARFGRKLLAARRGERREKEEA